MSIYAIPALGRYAVLQNNLSLNVAEGLDFQKDKKDFFTLFTHKSALGVQTSSHLENFTATEQLMDITTGAQESFFEAKTIFPFVLFPDTISLDRQKLTIIHRDFFRSARIASSQVKDIMNVEASIGPLFGSLTLTSKHFLNNTQTINFLKREDIVKAQRLIQGFMIAYRAHIDIDNIDKEQLTVLLNDLGRSNSS